MTTDVGRAYVAGTSSDDAVAGRRGWSGDDLRRAVAAHDAFVTERLLGGVE